MASTTASIGPFRALAGGVRPPVSQLWQVPAFALGLLAFAAVCALRPPWTPSTPAEDSSLAELRQQVREKDFDRDRILVLGARAVGGAATPQAAAEAHFLLGTAYLILAERAAPGKGGDDWREACKHLEQARSLGIAEDDRAHLDYRLARVWAHTGEPPARVIAALIASIERGADDDVDALAGYGLLADAYLKLPRPDVDAALAATEKQIGLPIVAAELLAPARLRRGELLLRKGKDEEAREVLKNIGAKAPPPILSAARRLRAQSLETAGLWAEAVPAWREILDENPADRDAVLYHLGLGLRNCGGPMNEEALRVWDECLAGKGTGDAGRAAALGLGELRLQLGQAEPALAAFTRAVGDLKEPGDWRNALVPLPRAREIFEASCKTAHTARAFEAAIQVAELYERLAPPGRAAEVRGEAAEAAARAAQDQARHAAGEAAKTFLGNAEALLRQAGEAFEQAARAQSDPGEQAERLWRAGNDLLEGHAVPQRTIGAFQRFLALAERPDMMAAERFNARITEGWYKLGLAGRDAGWPKQNLAPIFGKAANSWKWSGRYLYRARYELAMLDHDKASTNWSDSTKDQLEQNLHRLREAGADRDDEAREKTLYTLATLYFDRFTVLEQQQQHYNPDQKELSREAWAVLNRAIDTLEEALHAFPNNADAIEARYRLADCYRKRADQRNFSLLPVNLTVEGRIEIEQKVVQDREKAFANYLEVSRALEAIEPRGDYEEGLLFCALRLAADMRYWAGDYEKSGELFAAVAERLRNRHGFEVVRASALVGVLRAYQVLSTSYPSTQSDHEVRERMARRKVEQALEEIRADLPKLDPKIRKEFDDYLKTFVPPAR